MSFNQLDYCQYLLISQKNYTLTNLAEHLQDVSHDQINRYLRKEKFTPDCLWNNVKKDIQSHQNAAILFDDTVADKSYSEEIELVRRQYSGTEHRVIRGIGLINCVYFNPELGLFWIIDYRIYDPDSDGKTKLEHVADMLNNIVDNKKLSFTKVLMDSWYSSQKLMGMIDDLGKIYYCPLKKNRLVDDTGGVEKYKSIEKLTWSQIENESGKLIKIKNFPKNKKVKLFRVAVSTNRTEYVTTNDLTQQSNLNVKEICAQRWKIEEFHRELKQLTGIESCQCRKAIIQRNHIACAILVWNYLKKIANLTQKTVYQLKTELLSNYLTQELKFPSITMKLV
ncbi:MAG: transposase [Tatlockia sp.]|nr:transposase [Tatlockia sp.]